MERSAVSLYFSGNVQGVGFRAATQRFARSGGIVGFVRNLPDGRVEAVLTADELAIERLIIRLKGLFGNGIQDIQQITGITVEEFSGFNIRT